MKMNSGIPPAIRWSTYLPTHFDRFAPEWDDLVAHGRYPPFMHSTFVRQLIQSFGCADGQIAIGRRNGAAVAAGIFVPAGLGRWRVYQPSQLPLGAWLVLPSTGTGQAVRGLFSALPGPVLVISFSQRDPLTEPRPSTGGNQDSADYIATGWVDIDGSYEDFWQARGKNLRQGLPKQRRKIESEYGRIDFDLFESVEDVETALKDFAALESAGWKAENGTAISETNEQGRFYRSMLREFASMGRALAVRLSAGGRPIAVAFGVRDETTLVLLKTTYDESMRAFSPGQLLHEQLFQGLFNRPLVRRLEFFGRMMEWHTRWTDSSRVLYHLDCYRWPAIRQAANLVRRLRSEATSP